MLLETRGPVHETKVGPPVEHVHVEGDPISDKFRHALFNFCRGGRREIAEVKTSETTEPLGSRSSLVLPHSQLNRVSLRVHGDSNQTAGGIDHKYPRKLSLSILS